MPIFWSVIEPQALLYAASENLYIAHIQAFNPWGPIRGQHSGHVITRDQWEASIIANIQPVREFNLTFHGISSCRVQVTERLPYWKKPKSNASSCVLILALVLWLLLSSCKKCFLVQCCFVHKVCKYFDSENISTFSNFFCVLRN